MADDSRPLPGTRVFKKTSADGKITTYIGKRDFIDHQSHVDLIDGMILVDPEILNKRVHATLTAAFRYGREDMDVLGLQFRKDLITLSVCVYPPQQSSSSATDNAPSIITPPPVATNGSAIFDSATATRPRPLSRLQERLKKKLGANAYPFWFELPPNAPSSVTLQPAQGDTGKPCGSDYELCTYVAEKPDDKPKKMSCVGLAIRKLTYAPLDAKKTPQPTAEVSKEFLLSAGLLHLEATLDKGMYYHGESISVNVNVQNNSNKTVKKVKTSVIQVADICLFTTASYTCEVARLESTDGCPIESGSTLSKVYTLCPLLANNKDKRGLALDGQLKYEDTNLASSTIMANGMQAENLGIVVKYKVKVRLVLGGAFGGEVSLELPFLLTHPKPPPSPPLNSASGGGDGGGRGAAHRVRSSSQTGGACDDDDLNMLSFEPALDVDLIQLDTDGAGDDDDIVFEDFARLRLKGADSIDHD